MALLCGACGDTSEDRSADAIDAQMGSRCLDDTPEFVATPEAGLLARGSNGTTQARIIAAAPAMPERFENDWTVRFTDASGAALEGVEIADACVFMPVHGHGGVPSGVTATGEPGTFDLEGLNLFMRGPWEVQLAVTTEDATGSATEFTSCDRDRRRPGSDLVLFQVCVPDD